MHPSIFGSFFPMCTIYLLPARRPKGWWVHPSKSNSPPSWTRCPELRSTGVRPLGGNSALRNLEVKQMGGLLKKSCAKNGEPVVEDCRVESFSMETASEAAPNPCHCGRGGWTPTYFTKGGGQTGGWWPRRRRLVLNWSSLWWTTTERRGLRKQLTEEMKTSRKTWKDSKTRRDQAKKQKTKTDLDGFEPSKICAQNLQWL